MSFRRRLSAPGHSVQRDVRRPHPSRFTRRENRYPSRIKFFNFFPLITAVRHDERDIEALQRAADAVEHHEAEHQPNVGQLDAPEPVSYTHLGTLEFIIGITHFFQRMAQIAPLNILYQMVPQILSLIHILIFQHF